MKYLNITLFIAIVLAFIISLSALFKNTKKGTIYFASLYKFKNTDFLKDRCKENEYISDCYNRESINFVKQWKTANVFGGIGAGLILVFIVLNFKKLFL